jgi:hypothetical protein
MIHYSFSLEPRETRSDTEGEALPLSEETIIRILKSIASHAA